MRVFYLFPEVNLGEYALQYFPEPGLSMQVIQQTEFCKSCVAWVHRWCSSSSFVPEVWKKKKEKSWQGTKHNPHQSKWNGFQTDGVSPQNKWHEQFSLRRGIVEYQHQVVCSNLLSHPVSRVATQSRGYYFCLYRAHKSLKLIISPLQFLSYLQREKAFVLQRRNSSLPTKKLLHRLFFSFLFHFMFLVSNFLNYPESP